MSSALRQFQARAVELLNDADVRLNNYRKFLQALIAATDVPKVDFCDGDNFSCTIPVPVHVEFYKCAADSKGVEHLNVYIDDDLCDDITPRADSAQEILEHLHINGLCTDLSKFDDNEN